MTNDGVCIQNKMDCLFKMMIFLCKFPGGVAMSGPIPERVNGNIVQNVLKIAI